MHFVKDTRHNNLGLDGYSSIEFIFEIVKHRTKLIDLVVCLGEYVLSCSAHCSKHEIIIRMPYGAWTRLTETLGLCIVTDEVTAFCGLLRYSSQQVSQRFNLLGLYVAHDVVEGVHGCEEFVNPIVALHLSLHDLHDDSVVSIASSTAYVDDHSTFCGIDIMLQAIFAYGCT